VKGHSQSAGTASIDMSSLPSGIYIVRAEAAESESSIKVIFSKNTAFKPQA
jgi:hypothetical protein